MTSIIIECFYPYYRDVNDFYYESFHRRWPTVSSFEPARVVLETMLGLKHSLGKTPSKELVVHTSTVDGRVTLDNARIAFDNLLPFVRRDNSYAAYHKSFDDWLNIQQSSNDRFQINQHRGRLRTIVFIILSQSSPLPRSFPTLDKIPLFYGTLCMAFERSTLPIEFPDAEIARQVCAASPLGSMSSMVMRGLIDHLPQLRHSLIYALEAERPHIGGPGWWNGEFINKGKLDVPQMAQWMAILPERFNESDSPTLVIPATHCPLSFWFLHDEGFGRYRRLALWC
jgi:hypothetical protein